MTETAAPTGISVGGETNINDEVIGIIAAVAARQIDGVASLGSSSFRRAVAERIGGREPGAQGIGVEAGRREAILDINIKVVYGCSIPDTVIKVRRSVASKVLELCGLITKEINITVVGIDFSNEPVGTIS